MFLHKINKMLRLQRAASTESSSSASKFGPKLGVWLSFVPRKLYKCSLCNLRFNSMNALGGHQNAHRHQRNEMQKLMNMHLRPTNRQPIRSGATSKQKTFYEFLPLKEGYNGVYGYGVGFGIKDTCHQTPKHVSPAYNNGQSSLFRDQQLHVMMAAGGGSFLEASISSSANGALFYGGLNTTIGASMTEMDLTLKL